MFLLTNDDGIDATGLKTLQTIALRRGSVVVAAPREEQSGVSHQVTDRKPITVRSLTDDQHAVAGTPADCARIGLLHLTQSPQWLLSGINAGGNLGSDIYMSGTVAAAREAALLGVPAIAISQYRRSTQHEIDWRRTAAWTERVLDSLLSKALQAGEFWNVNLPDPADEVASPDMVICPVDPGHHAVAYEQTQNGYVYRGRYQQRHREPGCDVDICFSGRIAVSRLSLSGTPSAERETS